MAVDYSKQGEKFNLEEAAGIRPKISIIIPTLNCAQSIAGTLESLLSQEYQNFEIIVVDASSVDRTIEVIQNFQDERVRLYTVPKFQRYEMMNKGIALATGEYLNFLFPGDYYLTKGTLKDIMHVIEKSHHPVIVYCGSLIRVAEADPKILYRDLTIDLLKKGLQPTAIQSCWFQSHLFSRVGKFDTTYQIRGGYELLCRTCLNYDVKIASTSRVLTDYDMRYITKKMVFYHFWETVRTLYKYFGYGAILEWMTTQKDFKRFFKLWWKSLELAFLGRR